MKRTALLAAVGLILTPAFAAAHNAGASENLTIRGAVPTDKAHDAVKANGRGNHPSADFRDDSLLDRNPVANGTKPPSGDDE